SRRCRPPSPAPPTAPSSHATTSAASEPSTRRSPDHVHVQCGGTSGTRHLVPVGPRRLVDDRPRGGATPPWAATDVQRSSCLISWQVDGAWPSPPGTTGESWRSAPRSARSSQKAPGSPSRTPTRRPGSYLTGPDEEPARPGRGVISSWTCQPRVTGDVCAFAG